MRDGLQDAEGDLLAKDLLRVGGTRPRSGGEVANSVNRRAGHIPRNERATEGVDIQPLIGCALQPAAVEVERIDPAVGLHGYTNESAAGAGGLSGLLPKRQGFTTR